MVNSFLKTVCGIIAGFFWLGLLPLLILTLITKDIFDLVVYIALLVFFNWIGFKKEYKKEKTIRKDKALGNTLTERIYERYVPIQSETEKRLLFELNRIGLNPKPQYKISRMTVDFAFLEEKVVVEVDGSNFHSSEKARKKDYERDSYLQSIGWKVRRITAEEVFRNPISSAYKIKNFLS